MYVTLALSLCINTLFNISLINITSQQTRRFCLLITYLFPYINYSTETVLSANMSALLPISERVYELNLCAEHGYTYRSFKRAVRVYQSADYKSALFLVYATYKHALPNRKTPYRNHFTLYRNADTVVVVLSLIHI